MRPSALVGAVIGAALGALVWAGVAALTGLEIGWIAWGVGGAVGLGAALGGGSDASTGTVCALLALASIFVGKLIAVDMVAEGEIREATSEFAAVEIYDELKGDAADFVEPMSDDEYAAFMVDHGYTAVAYPEDVTAFELAGFKREAAPMLREFRTRNFTYAQWKDYVADEAVREWEATGSAMEVVQENLNFIDVIFGLLGVVTAFQVGARGLGGSAEGRIPYRPSSSYPRSPEAAPDLPDPHESHASSGAPILRDEPPNPYAYREPAPPPLPPAAMRTIPRARQPVRSPLASPAEEEAPGEDPFRGSAG